LAAIVMHVPSGALCVMHVAAHAPSPNTPASIAPASDVPASSGPQRAPPLRVRARCSTPATHETRMIAIDENAKNG
jgi:hypothetical protein